MKTNRKHTCIKLRQWASSLLVFLFLFVSAAQLFHTHPHVHAGDCGQLETRAQVQLSDHCSLCDYYHHNQGQQIFLFYPAILTTVFSKAILIYTPVPTGNYKLTLQGFINKGPPLNT